MAGGGRGCCIGLLAASLLAALLACKREDPRIRALTTQAAQADEAARQLRQAWSDQFRRLSVAGIRDLRSGAGPLVLTADQKAALEARVRVEKDSSRRALLQEILDKEGELAALRDRAGTLKEALPAPEIAAPGDRHYDLALRFLMGRGRTETQAREALSHVAISERLAPGSEVYHFYVDGEYGTWVSQGEATLPPRISATPLAGRLAGQRDEALAAGRRLQRELGILQGQKRLIEQEIAAIQAERAGFLEGRASLQSENAQHLADLNSLHYLVGSLEALEREGIIDVPLFGKAHSGRNWTDTAFTRHLDLRAGHRLVLRAQDAGLAQIGKVNLVPGSYLPEEHYRLTLSPDRRTATVELLALSRFRNDKVAFALTE